MGAVQGECVNKVAFTYFTNITNLVADAWIFIFPMSIILGLQARMDKRISLCFIFSVGLGTCAISGARLSFIFSVASKDLTWWEAPLSILSALEPCGGILCVNLPVVYRDLVKTIQQVKATVKGSQSRSGIRSGPPAFTKELDNLGRAEIVAQRSITQSS